jgi:putative SOS response-associated peptidase YedK
MCSRYRRTTAEEEIACQYHIPIPPQRDLPISYNIAPTQNVLVIRRNPETGEQTLDALRWGLIPNWAKDEKIPYNIQMKDGRTFVFAGLWDSRPFYWFPASVDAENETTRRSPTSASRFTVTMMV